MRKGVRVAVKESWGGHWSLMVVVVAVRWSSSRRNPGRVSFHFSFRGRLVFEKDVFVVERLRRPSSQVVCARWRGANAVSS